MKLFSVHVKAIFGKHHRIVCWTKPIRHYLKTIYIFN